MLEIFAKLNTLFNRKHHILNNYGTIIILVSLIVKTSQLFGIPILTSDDTQGYFDSAISFLTNNKGDFGLRMPLYPFFVYSLVSFWGSKFSIIIIEQVVSLISVFFLFKLSKLFLNEKYSFYCTLLFVFCPVSIYNSFILTESLGLSLSIIFFYYYLKEYFLPKFSNILFVSLILSLLILLRPQFVFYLSCIIFLPFFLNKIKLYYSFLFIPFLILFVWLQVQYNYTGHYAVTNLVGFNLINHTGKFIEFASPKYDFIKNEYLRYRDIKMKTVGNPYFVIYEIDDTLKNNYNLTTIELSHILKDMSIELISRHPIEYIKSLWAATKFALIIPGFEGSNQSFVLFLSRFFIPFYQILIGFGLTLSVVLTVFSKNKKYYLLIFLIFIIFVSSILFDCSENTRYFIYSYPIILIFAFLGFKLIKDYFRIIG